MSKAHPSQHRHYLTVDFEKDKRGIILFMAKY